MDQHPLNEDQRLESTGLVECLLKEAGGLSKLEHAFLQQSPQKWRLPLRSERNLLQTVLTYREPIISSSKLLAPDKKTRDAAVLGLRRFLVATAEEPMDKPEMAKLWKGIFYCSSL